MINCCEGSGSRVITLAIVEGEVVIESLAIDAILLTLVARFIYAQEAR